MTLLRIDSSLRIEGSYSRILGDYFTQQWQKQHPSGTVIHHDVGKHFIPHLDNFTLTGFYNPSNPTSLLQVSDTFIQELMACDHLLLTVPMYNFGMPSSLKAYFDLVVRTEKTFRHEDITLGLLTNKKAFIISSMGAMKSEPLSLVELHLQHILNYIGITDTSFIPVDGTADECYAQQKTTQQKTTINNLLMH